MELQEKNYTNPEDRGRFGFSMSGEYRTPYKAETFLVSLLIGVAVVASIAFFFTVKRIYDQSKMEQDSSASFVLIGSAIALVVVVVVMILVFGVGINSVKKGFLCQYSANDETFTATIGGDLHVIQYKNVTHVNFKPRIFLGKIRGYDVTVRVNGKDEFFSICSDGYLSPQATPFYIIQERLDIMRRSHSSTASPINSARSDSRAISRTEVDKAQTGSVSAMDRMAQLLGETSNMPELSMDASPSQQAAARVTQMMNEYPSSEMPSIGAKARQPSAHMYIGTDGREHHENEVLGQGTFYVRAKLPIALALIAAFVALWAGLLYLVFSFNFTVGGSSPAISFKMSINLTLPYKLIVTATSPIVAYLVIIKTHGTTHNYKADGRGFYVTTKGKSGNEQILYKDVLSVDYTPTKLLWGARGYKVDILTTYGLITYDYIFPRFNHKIAKQYLPFEVIRKNIPNRDQNNT